MSDPDFRIEIDTEVSRAAAQAGMEQYRRAIADTLQSYLDSSRPRRLLEENRKIASEQRSKQDALRSVRVLVTEASRYASAAGRKIVTVEDIQAAYQAKFCQVWPFC